MSRTLQERHYPESRFRGYTNVDGTLAFYGRIQSLLPDRGTVLDVGCGPGARADDPVLPRRRARDMRGPGREVIGIDVDPKSASNPTLDRFDLIEGGRWPVEDASVELAFSDAVLEHLEDPAAFFREARRVIVPGGCLCIRTPNVFSYFGVLSRMIPNRYHARVAGRVQVGREEADVYPTWYRCNTPWKLRRMLRAHGFQGVVRGHGSEPRYLSFSDLAYAMGVLYQRYAPRVMQPALLAVARKGGGEGGPG